jgi:hypothetical protein
MKLINQYLTREDASILCQTISEIEQTRPRVKEILQIEGELRDSKLANRVASELLSGNVIRVDNQRMKVSNHSSDEFPDLAWEPVEIERLKIYYVTGDKNWAHGPIDLDELEEVLPELDIYDTCVFYQELIEWKSLAELMHKYLSAH